MTVVAACLSMLGRRDEELAEWRGHFTRLGDKEMVKALDDGYAADGYRGAMRGAAALLDSRSESVYVQPVFAAELNVRAENPDRAFAWLERAFDARDQNLPFIGVIPTLAPLRNDPRFSALLRRMNLAPK
jgi:hypothetical protein